MGAVYFYHLTNHPLEVTLPMLLGKALGAGWRVAVRGRDEARLEWLDQRLWLGEDISFLPHGLSKDENAVSQPILLTTDIETANNANCVMAIDGAEVGPQEVETFERTCILFDGNDQDALAAARVQWKALVDAGCSAQYWAQDDGRWIKKAESEAKSPTA